MESRNYENPISDIVLWLPSIVATLVAIRTGETVAPFNETRFNYDVIRAIRLGGAWTC